jgi:UDP-glucose 4-epimerase
MLVSIMVVGGSGFIGSRLVRRLTDARKSVVSYDLVQDSSTKEDLKAVRADILDLYPLDRMFFDHAIEYVIHLVGLPVVAYCERNPHLSYLLNVASVQTTLEAMRKADVKRLVFASTAAVYRPTTGAPASEDGEVEPTGIYGRHKLMAEQAIHAYASSYGLEAVILRLFNVYGGDPSLGNDALSVYMRNAANGEKLVVKGPSKFRDFIHIDDVCSVLMDVATKRMDGNTINIGTGERTTLLQLANFVKQNFQDSVVQIERVEDDGQGLVADIRLAKSLLAFEPRPSSSGILTHVQYWKERLTRSSHSNSVGDTPAKVREAP